MDLTVRDICASQRRMQFMQPIDCSKAQENFPALVKCGRGLAVGSVNGGLGKAQKLSAGKAFYTKDRLVLRQ